MVGGHGCCLIMSSDPRQGWEPPEGASHRHLHRRRQAKALPSVTQLLREEPGQGSALLTPVPSAPSGTDCKSTCRRAPRGLETGISGTDQGDLSLPLCHPG